MQLPRPNNSLLAKFKIQNSKLKTQSSKLTTELSFNRHFFHPDFRDGAITATTRPLHRGRALIVVESEIARDDGALAAKVTQSQAFQYPRA